MNRLAVVVLAFLTVAILETTCTKSTDNFPEGMVECNDGKWHPCCIDDDCLGKQEMADCSDEYIICNDDYECECVCYKEGEDCSRDPDACCGEMYCDIFTDTCIDFSCETDADCPEDYYCHHGYCDRTRCITDSDCPPPLKCMGGECVTWGDCGEIAECVVAPQSGVTRTGSTVQFSAAAYLTSGAIMPAGWFSWTSSETNVAEITGGLATGGADTGVTTITATMDGCELITCNASLTNYGVVSAGFTRVVVVDEFTGFPIQGATVVLGAEPPATTDIIGIATFNVELGDANPADITVSKQDYNYVTYKGVKVSDVLVQMSPVYQLDFSQNPPVKQSGGIFGTFDFGMIRCEEPLKTCDVSLGLAGMSVPANLAHLNLDLFYRDTVVRQIEIGGGTEEVPLPTALALCLNQTCYEDGIYRATGVPGNRVAWGFGAKLDMEILVDALGLLPGENNLILELSKYMLKFYSAMIPNIDVEPVPNLPDGNPAFGSFLRQDMTLRIGTDQVMTFNPPALPVGVYDGVAVLGGVVVIGAGFVPLGLALGKDSLDEADIPDGVIDDPITLLIADVAGRIPESQVQRIVMVFAVKLKDDTGPRQWSGQVMFVDSFSGTHTLPDFILPVEATYDAQIRRLELIQVPAGANFVQAGFLGDEESSWNIFTEDFTSFDLPTAPQEGDRANTAGVFAVGLESGTYQQMVEFDYMTNVGQIELISSFSFTEVQ